MLGESVAVSLRLVLFLRHLFFKLLPQRIKLNRVTFLASKSLLLNWLFNPIFRVFCLFFAAPTKVEQIAGLPRSCIANEVIDVLLKKVGYDTGLT